MKYLPLLLILCMLCLCQSVQAQASLEEEPRTFEMQQGDSTITMKRYVMVLLHSGDQASTFSEAELEELQAAHMTNINKMDDSGKLMVAGPFGDDTELRGIFVLDVATIEEAKALVEIDPMIVAGRLTTEYHPWWAAVGTTFK